MLLLKIYTYLFPRHIVANTCGGDLKAVFGRGQENDGVSVNTRFFRPSGLIQIPLSLQAGFAGIACPARPQNTVVEKTVVLNIAGFRLFLVRRGEIAWTSRVMVGTPYRQTPVFRGDISYLEVNPTWTVPPTILAKDVLPAIRQDIGYLAAKDLRVLDHSGHEVDPAAVDWQKRSGGFPYLIRQSPGPKNALGRIKFMFPNEHAVYLHDTPSKYLFSQAERAFSHGCIRVEHPFDFAEQLLGPDGWDQQKFQEVLDAGKTKTVHLSKPLPVFLLYWTAMVEPNGVVHFFNDVYSRDTAVAEALDEPFQVDLPLH